MSEAVAVRTPVRFARETTTQVIGEIASLMCAHWDEVGHYRDMPLDPDFAKYASFERQNILRLYAARTDHLVGYAIFLLGTGMHYRDVLTAQETTVYMHPDHRPADAFLEWTDRQLEREGVQIITKHVKAHYNPRRAQAHVRLLQRKGYELQDYVLTRRL